MYVQSKLANPLDRLSEHHWTEQIIIALYL
jgi:hypothetical protein